MSFMAATSDMSTSWLLPASAFCAAMLRRMRSSMKPPAPVPTMPMSAVMPPNTGVGAPVHDTPAPLPLARSHRARRAFH
jgi:hypothetical protein